MFEVHAGAYVPATGGVGAEAQGFGSQLPAPCHSEAPAPVPVHVTGSVPPERVYPGVQLAVHVLPVGAVPQVPANGLARGAQRAATQSFMPVPVNAPSEHVGSVPVFE
jgi:hypothetical protein